MNPTIQQPGSQDNGTLDNNHLKLTAKNGQTKVVSLDEARQLGYDDTSISKALSDRYSANKTIQTIQSGGDPTVQASGTPLQQFNQNQALTSILEAEKYFGAGTDKSLALAKDSTRGSKASAGAQAFMKSLSDSDYQQRLDEFNAQMNLVVGGLTQLSGSGAPQTDEAKRLLASAPTSTSTDKEAKAWFNSVKKLGGMKVDETQDNSDQQTGQQNKGSGLPDNNPQQQSDLTTAALGGLVGPLAFLRDKRVREGLTPTNIVDFLKNSAEDTAKIAGGDTKTREEVSKDGLLQALAGPLANPKARNAAAEGLSYIAGPKILEGTLGAAKGAVKSFSPAARILERAAEISKVGDVSLSGDNLLESVQNSVKNVSPTQRTAINKFLETATEDWSGKKFSIQDAVDLLKNANKSYTAAGQTGKAASATFNDALSKSINSELSTVAPEVEAAQQALRKAYTNSGVLQKIFSPTNIGRGVVTGGAIAGVGKLLDLFKGQ